jgi:hypothetical protein
MHSSKLDASQQPIHPIAIVTSSAGLTLSFFSTGLALALVVEHNRPAATWFWRGRLLVVRFGEA